MRRALAYAVLVLPAFTPRVCAQDPFGLPLRGEAAEAFLRTAEVVRRRGLGQGITHSDQCTLRDATRTIRAIWKTIDELKRGVTTLEGGGVIVDLTDSWKHEVAAYELDKMIGTDLVPPTVERTIGGRTGSLQMWVEGAMTEADRKERKVAPPDVRAWNEQIYKVRLLHQLTDNTDARNIRNVLIDPSFRVYAVDSSRAFTPSPYLRSETALERFSRASLEALRALDRPTLDAKLGRWLTGPQIAGLLKRRDKIVARAERLVRERGEPAVLYR
jgi:hypothetical protein